MSDMKKYFQTLKTPVENSIGQECTSENNEKGNSENFVNNSMKKKHASNENKQLGKKQQLRDKCSAKSTVQSTKSIFEIKGPPADKKSVFVSDDNSCSEDLPPLSCTKSTGFKVKSKGKNINKGKRPLKVPKNNCIENSNLHLNPETKCTAEKTKPTKKNCPLNEESKKSSKTKLKRGLKLKHSEIECDKVDKKIKTGPANDLNKLANEPNTRGDAKNTNRDTDCTLQLRQEGHGLSLSGIHKLKKKSHKKCSKPQVEKHDLPKPTDAFQVMMDSRKKVIGANSPGKSIVGEENLKNLAVERDAKAKRRLCLEKWADLKGAKEKKELQQCHEQYVKKVLCKRATSFKTMLCSRKKDAQVKQSPQKISLVSITQSLETPKTRTTKDKSSKRLREFGSDAESSAHGIKKRKCTNKSPSKAAYIPGEIKSEVQKIAVDDFVKVLSPSIRKKESVLSYFEKVDHSPKDVDISENEISDAFLTCEKEHNAQVIKVKFKTVNRRKKKLKTKNAKLRLKSNRNNKNEELNTSDDVESMISNLQTEIIRTQETIKKLSRGEPRCNVKSSQDTDNVLLISTGDNTNTPSKGLRPKRIVRKPMKYTQESSDESGSNIESDEFYIFTPEKKQNKVDEDKRKKKPQLNINKENVKSESISKGMKNVSPLKIVNIQSPGIMACVRSPVNSTPTKVVLKEGKLAPAKLAPLFVKSLPKPMVDPSVLAARQKFLQSGMPDVMRKQTEKPVDVLVDFNYFPSISHVQQLPENTEHGFDAFNLPIVQFKNIYIKNDFDELSHMMDKSKEASNNSKSYIKTSDLSDQCSSCDVFMHCKSFGYKEGVHSIKLRHPEYPVCKTFRQLREKFIKSMKVCDISYNNKIDVIDIEDSNFSESVTFASETHARRDFNVWTEKYKPISSDDILGNFRSVKHIKKWLEMWKEYNEVTVNKGKRIRRLSSSSSEFCASDLDSRDSMRLPSNTIIVVGPQGSGKTSSIYAIANELNINVLEVNASSKRTGKRILSELQEATQSHKVLTTSNSESSSFGSFANMFDKSSKESNSQELVSNVFPAKSVKLPNKKNKKRRDRTTLVNDLTSDCSNDSFSQKSSVEINKMSLLLIEDADIVFEEDDGFVTALSQIVLSSKRPVLIVASDAGCSHLQRFMTEQNVIQFCSLSGKLLGPWLEVLMLIESGKVIPSLTNTILDHHNGDIRKAILQLQYWILGSIKNSDEENPSLLNQYNADLETKDLLKFAILTDEESNLSWSNNERLSLCNENSSRSDVQDVELETVRQALLQELSCPGNLENVWYNFSHIFEPSNNGVHESTNINQIGENGHTTSRQCEDISCIADFLDDLSAVDLLQPFSKRPQTKFNFTKHWETPLGDSLSELEDFSMFDHHHDFSSLWSEYFIQSSCKSIQERLHIKCVNPFSLHIVTGSNRQSVHSALSEAVPCGTQLDRGALVLDYLSTLRSICRSEKERSESNFKRNNRFYHYLRSVNLDSKDCVFEKACQILESAL